MLLPKPRGRISAALARALRTGDAAPLGLELDPALGIDPLADDDLQVALWTCYELHYRGFDDVDGEWEWHPGLIAFRNALEAVVLGALRRDVPSFVRRGSTADALRDLVAADQGPGLARYMQQDATREQFVEFAMHRSIYQLKEADPHSWAIPRLAGAVKVALLEIQFDEYGGGDVARMHSELYRDLLLGLGLDDTYGAYVDAAPGITLAISNVMSLFGLRRELLGALLGHLAAYEMTSSEPCRRYARGLRRLGGDDVTCRFYDEHVLADALHEQLVMHDLCEAFAAAEPDQADDILFGAAACLLVDNRFAAHVLECWADGRTSLSQDAAVADLATVG